MTMGGGPSRTGGRSTACNLLKHLFNLGDTKNVEGLKGRQGPAKHRLPWRFANKSCANDHESQPGGW